MAPTNQEELEKEYVEYEDLLPKRRSLAASMYRKDKISAQKAAEMAGDHLEDFLEEPKNVTQMKIFDATAVWHF